MVDKESETMDTKTVARGSVIVSIIILIAAFVCMFQGISTGVLLFALAFLLGMITIGLFALQSFRISWDGIMRRPRIERKTLSESFDDLRLRYAKGQITTEQFRQMKKELGK